MAVIISVSLDQKHKEFIDEMGISPSGLLQRSINSLIEDQRVSQKYVDELKGKIERLQTTITSMGNFIDKHNLFEEYVKISN